MERNLNLNISLNGDEQEEFTKIDHDEGNYFFSIGILFCPKTTCKNGEEIITLDATNPEENEQGECFKIFIEVFEKLKEKNLISEYNIDEIECFIEASHVDYKFLNLISLVQNNEYYGLGFNILDFKIGLLTDGPLDILNIENWLRKLKNIIKEITPNHNLLINNVSDLKIENFVDIEMYSLED